MTRRRNYILKNANAPEEDLWVEMDDTNLAVPLFRIYCESEQGKMSIVSLTTAMAIRLQTVLNELLEISNKPIEGYATESND